MAYLKIGNRIPIEYFYTAGKGQSDYGGKGLPFEAGAYDAALTEAKIEQGNIVLYSSLIPPEAKEITREKALKKMHWGAVVESILAKMTGTKGQHINASVLTTQVYNPKKEYQGTFVCEYAGYGNDAAARSTLIHDVAEMVERRGWGTIKGKAQLHKLNKTSKGWYFKPHRFHGENLIVTKKFGACLAGLCFTEYAVPLSV